jgi:hypothetical protein
MKANTEKERKRGRYFRSDVFKRLFLSYTLIIVAVFGIFIGWSAWSYREETTRLARQEWEQKAVSWGTWMDQQLMQAQMLCASANASESARSALQTIYVEKNTLNSLQLYNLLGELNRLKGTVRSTCLHNMILAFQGENKVFLPGAVYSLEGTCVMLQDSPWFGVGTAAELLGAGGQQITLNKEYLIYGEAYTGFSSQSSPKGEVLVLIDQDQIRAALREHIPGTTKIIISQRISSVQDADRVLVLDNGRVSGFDTHEALLRDNAIYREICQAQQEAGGDFDRPGE